MNKLTRWIGNQKGCAPVTGRLVRWAGVTWIVQRSPVTRWSWFAIDPETVKEIKNGTR